MMVTVSDERREELRRAMDEEGAKVVAARLHVSRVTLYRILWRGEASERIIRCMERATNETTRRIPLRVL